MRCLSVVEVGAVKLTPPACSAWHVIKTPANMEGAGPCSLLIQKPCPVEVLGNPALRSRAQRLAASFNSLR